MREAFERTWMEIFDEVSSDAQLARQLAKLWPHREHESNIVLGQLCRIGSHRWRGLDLTSLAPGKEVVYCFRCSRIRIDRVIYDP